jgi:hypothetical protein
MITGEGLIQVANLIEETNRMETIKYVCYDNGCHLEKHVNNTAYLYNDRTKAIKYFIDRLHIKNHNKECVKYSCDKDDVVRLINSSVCEQLFYLIGKFKHISKHMSKYHFNFFYLMLFQSMNNEKR